MSHWVVSNILVDWINLVQDKDKRWALLNTVMNFRWCIKCGEFSTSWGTVSFSRPVLLFGVRYFNILRYTNNSFRRSKTCEPFHSPLRQTNTSLFACVISLWHRQCHPQQLASLLPSLVFRQTSTYRLPLSGDFDFFLSYLRRTLVFALLSSIDPNESWNSVKYLSVPIKYLF